MRAPRPAGEVDGKHLYCTINRYYDPEYGRLTQIDPVRVLPGYLYTGNNPMRYVDPHGLCVERVWFDSPSWALILHV